MDKEACAIGGTTINDFLFWHCKESGLCEKIKLSLLDAITILYEAGIQRYFIGCECGVNIWAAEIIFELAKDPLYNDIELYCVVTPGEQDEKLSDNMQKRYRRIFAECTHTEFLLPQGSIDNSFYRNKFIMENCSTLIIVSEKEESRDNLLISCAKAVYADIILINPNTAEITALYPPVSDEG